MKPQVTPSTRHVLDVLRGLLHTQKVQPTLNELAAACGFKSNNAARWHLRKLRAAGLLEYEDRSPRSFRFPKRGKS